MTALYSVNLRVMGKSNLPLMKQQTVVTMAQTLATTEAKWQLGRWEIRIQDVCVLGAMMIVIAGFPGAFVHAFFTGSLLIENIFSLDGLGLLTYESVMNRDYPVVFANIYILALLGLVVNLISDLTYTWIDPRIDFETRET